MKSLILNIKNKYKIVTFSSLALFFAILVVLTYDFPLRPRLYGDQACFILQALSIANDFDLKYSEKDIEYWKSLQWRDNPDGLFFQKYSKGYAFAKPYGYSLFLAPFIFLLGSHGLIVGNLCIFILLNFFIYLSLRSFYSELESLLLSVAYSFFSYVYMYIYFIHSDLFLAMIMSIIIFLLSKMLKKSNIFYFISLSVLFAFITSEKLASFFVLFLIVGYFVYKRKNIKSTFLLIALFVLSYAIFISPYLYYSDYKSWNPYSGERYYSSGTVPFYGDQSKERYWKAATGKYFESKYITNKVFDKKKLQERSLSFYYYFFGAYTGMIVFLPLSFFTIIFSFYKMIRRFDIKVFFLLSGIFLYIFFYIFFFSNNYYGGEHSLGNRYYLQISSIIVLNLVFLKLSNKSIYYLFILSFLFSLGFLYHHHFDPKYAHIEFLNTGLIQKTMPFERTLRPLDHYAKSNLINPHLYPTTPKYVFCRYSISVGNYTVAIRDQKGKHNDIFLEIENPNYVFVETVLNDAKIWVSKGFFKTEGSHIWSRRKSSILLKKNDVIESFSIKSFLPDTSIKLKINNRNFSEKAPFSFSIDTSKFSDDWIIIEFEADKSDSPINLKQSEDSRDLSFALLYYGISDYKNILVN